MAEHTSTNYLIDCQHPDCVAVVRGPLADLEGWRRQKYKHDVEMSRQFDPSYVPPYAYGN